MKKYIDKSRKELLQKIEWLEQKLDETRKLEQFLNAANQQLQANEQQLKAANQQLRATEQQLRASNQQLKAAEKEARTAKEMYKKSSLLRNAILESPQKIIVFALDKNYRYLDFTTLHKQTMKEIWGVDIQVGDRMLDFIKNADDRSKAKANFDRALRGEYFVLQEEYGDKQLKRTFYEDHYNPVFGPDGHKIIGVSVYVVEITRQKETEQRLQKQVQEYTALNKKYKLQNEKLNALNRQLQATERQLRTVNKQLAKREEILTEAQKIAELGHWELDLIHDSLSWSDETFRIFGFKPQEFDPSYPLFLERVHPDDRKKVDDAYNQSLKNRTDYEVEHRILLKSGEMKYVIEKCHTHYNNNGQPTHSIGTVLDVTRQKLTEEALRETMLQYQNIFNSTSDAMLIFDMEGNVVEANPQACKVYGYTYEEMCRLHGKDIVHAEYHSLFNKFMKDLFAIGEFQAESVDVRKGGIPFQVDVKGKLLYMKGKPHLLAVVRDITERKKAEAELIRLSTAVQQSPAILTITDPQGNLQYVNPKFEEVSGYTASEIIGKHVQVLGKDTQSKEIIQNMWETISAGKVWHGEFHNQKKNGEPYWELASVSPVFDNKGRITNYIKVSEDITDRKRKEQIQRILHNISNAAITAIDLHDFARIVQNELGTIIDTSNFYIALYQEDKNHFTFIFQQDEHDHFDILPAEKTLTGYVFNTQKPLLATEKTMQQLEESGKINAFGAPAKCWLGIPLLINKKAIGVFAVQNYRNKDAFREADIEVLEIISHQISLSINRKKKEEELKIALEKAQESDRLKSAFLANMSHEIRTPMNGILGFINLLNEPGISEAEREKYTAIVNKSGDRLLSTINDLIDISKIEARQVEVVESKVALTHLLEELHTFFSLEAKNKNLTLHLKPATPREDTILVTDEAKLHGILTNLLKNALKFTHQGGVTFGYRLLDDFVEFFVEDTGIGIPQNRQQAVFNRFEQADINYSTRPYEGSGLGLTIAKAYVEMLGGEIRLSSEVGKGSLFSFTIPLKTGEKQKPLSSSEKNKPAPSETQEKAPTLLLVEDDETSALYMQAILKDKFKKIYLASSGTQAVTLCRNHPETDIILMDIRMPGLNGIEATQQIRRFNKKVGIIAQTAYAMSGDEEKVLQAGCDAYISKPIDKKKLLTLIERLVKS